MHGLPHPSWLQPSTHAGLAGYASMPRSGLHATLSCAAWQEREVWPRLQVPATGMDALAQRSHVSDLIHGLMRPAGTP